MSDDNHLYRPNVGVMLARPDGRVFVGERIDTPGAWQMPQGGIDKGETPREAGLRELEEETGVARRLVTVEAETGGWLRYDFPEEVRKKVGKGKFLGQRQKWFLLRFHGSDTDVNLETDHPEFGRWEWATPDTLVPRIVTFKQPVYEAVLKEFGPRL